MATWPSSLPLLPDVAGYNLTPMGQTIRSGMEVGTARVRRISDARNDQVSVTIYMTIEQVDTFRAWFDDSVTGLNGGTNWFTGLGLVVDGAVSSSFECRFVNSPKFNAAAPVVFVMSGTLEVR